MPDGFAWKPLDSAPSLWRATATPPCDFPVLHGDARADVVIIGAGYTGLSAAHYLARSGLEPVVLEANQPGWGASGRNGGVVTAKFRVAFPDIAATHGRDMAKRMYDIAHQATDIIAELVDVYGIHAAQLTRSGQIKAAHNHEIFAIVVREAEWLRAELGDTKMTVLSADRVREETGSAGFVGGVLDASSGGIHPLNYLNGLANGVAAQGVTIYADTPALCVRRERESVLVETPGGTVRAGQAIIATNGYSDLTPATSAFRTMLIPFRSAIIATERLSHNLAASVMPTRRTYTETKRMMRWFRMVDDRVVFGGRGAFGKKDSAGAFRALHRAMTSIFPQLSDVRLAYQWSGLVAMTLDQVPHVGRAEDRVLFALGYNGAGVAMSNLMGRYLAAFARGETPDVGLLDARRMRRVPFYPLREPAVRMVAGWYQLLDAIGR